MIEKIDRYYLEITSIDKLKDKQKPIDNLKIDLLKSENFELNNLMEVDKKNYDKKINLILLRKIGLTTKPGQYRLSPKELKKILLMKNLIEFHHWQYL